MRVVAADTCFLFHLHQVGRLGVLGQLEGFRFVIPGEVQGEFVRPESRALVAGALDAEWITLVSPKGIDELVLRKELIDRRIGKGEAACLTLAISRGWSVASDDEGRLFVREAESRIGPERIISSPDVVLMAVRRGLIPVEEADRFPGIWAVNNYELDITAFSELL
jgi:predicted nucleic acid-binding protein